MLSWQDKFLVGLPFRKLLKIMQSLPVNLWMVQLRANGMLGSDVHSVRDLVLCGVDKLWQQVNRDWSLCLSGVPFASQSYARILPSWSAFKRQADKVLGSFSEKQKLQDVWHRYRTVLQDGFALRSAGEAFSANAQQVYTFSDMQDYKLL